MININIKKISDNQADGMLICKEKTTGEIIKILLSTLAEDGVKLYEDGKIEIGGPRPPIEYFTDDPPKTDEVYINITGWFYLHYELKITIHSNYTLIRCIPKY